jgi:hypothetical protein
VNAQLNGGDSRSNDGTTLSENHPQIPLKTQKNRLGPRLKVVVQAILLPGGQAMEGSIRLSASERKTVLSVSPGAVPVPSWALPILNTT